MAFRSRLVVSSATTTDVQNHSVPNLELVLRSPTRSEHDRQVDGGLRTAPGGPTGGGVQLGRAAQKVRCLGCPLLLCQLCEQRTRPDSDAPGPISQEPEQIVEDRTVALPSRGGARYASMVWFASIMLECGLSHA